MAAEDYTLHFGKHKGVRLGNIPKDYLVWILKNDFPKGLKDRIKQVLGNEQRWSYPDKHPVPPDVILDPTEECPF